MQTEPKTKLALCILAVAVAMGLLADALLREVPWGINLTIWIGCLVGGLFLAKRAGGGTLEVGSAVMIVPVVVFGICFAWRDSSMLRGLDLVAIIVAAALVISRQTAALWMPSLSRVAGSVLNLVAHSFAGFVHLISRDIDWSQQRNSSIAANTRSAAIGVMIAAPMLLVFTILFVRADAAFEKLFTDLLQINVGRHLAPIALGTWLAGSYLRGVLVPSVPCEVGVTKSPIRLGATELNVALGLLNVLFFAFVTVQLRYLFGNAQTVELTPGLTYATYARRGFFELVVVALLVLPVLLTGDRVHSADQSKRGFRIQSVILVGMVFCIMASAMHRMRLYQFAYGLTELRFYVSAFMIFLAAVFVLFGGTVLRGWGGLFPMGTVGLGFAAILVLHAINPDRWIASANLENARAGRIFDSSYLKELSADAVPTVLANASAVNLLDREEFVNAHKNRLLLADDWRSWNYGRHAATRAIRELPR